MILHLGVNGRGLYAWGERFRADGEEAAPSAPEGVAALPHPRGLDAGKLRRALSLVGAAPSARAETLTAWLPTRDRRPARVVGNVYGLGRTHADDPLQGWSVDAVRLDGEHALSLLQIAAIDPLFADGLAAGADVRYWARMVRLAPPVAARQQGLPGLLGGSERDAATWEPVFGRPVEASLADAARQLPAVARALLSADGDRSANSALSRFIAAASEANIPTGAGFDRELRRHAAGWVLAADDAEGASGGGFFDPEAPTIAALVPSVPAWRRPLIKPGQAKFELTFQLAEPDPESATARGRWRLEYLLSGEGRADPPLPASAAWRAPREAALALGGNPLLIRAQLLAFLREAGEIFPAIARSLGRAQPSGVWLSTRQAYDFMSAGADGLWAAGFGIEMPEWWQERGRAPRLAARARVSAPDLAPDVRLTLDEVVQVDWELAIGGQSLSRGDVESLALDRSPLVNFQGRWLEVDVADLEAASRFLDGRITRKATLRDVVQIAVGATGAPHEFDFDGIEAAGRVGAMLDRLNGRAKFAQLPPPQGFSGTLRPYQLTGYSWLAFLQRWGLGACLADDMGLGKTVQTLALIQRDYRQGSHSPVLVVCPTSVIYNWELESGRFTPDLPLLVHHGAERLRGEEFAARAGEQAIVITSYALLRRDADFLARISWGGVVLDEAQNVKNPDSGQARAARRLNSGYRIALTGTPVENHVGDLWAIMEFLNPGLLGSRRQFRERFQRPIQRHGDRAAAARLSDIVQPFILRRLKSDRTVISDLPEKIESKQFCELTDQQARLYAATAGAAQGKIESATGMRRRGQILKVITRLKQICNHPAQIQGDDDRAAARSGKLIRLSDMLEEVLEAGGKALIFSQFVGMGRIIQEHIRQKFGCRVLFLHGGTGRRRRQRMVNQFQSADGPPVFVLSLKAGGSGLNLTAANHVFHYDRWWNPAVENQATDRAFRIGQQRNVQVHKLICAGTLEEKIDAMLERKLAVTDSVIGTGEDWLTELSDRELRDVLRLGREALAG